VPAYIPEAYIPDVNQRLVFYKKLANVEDRTELEELGYEMEDRFGPLPELVLALIEVMDLRRVLRMYMVTAVSKRAEMVTVHFHPDSPIKAERLVDLVQKDQRQTNLTPDLRLSIALQPDEEVTQALKTLLQDLGESC
jgi:transcription-repair coupling factor (superfamily II helicase)